MIYLDNNATTALDPRVFKEMALEFQGDPANPSSAHALGKKAKAKLESAREDVARFFSVRPKDVIFTSGGTESINLFLRGIEKKGPIVSTHIEHSCVHKTLQALDAQITYVPVSAWGAPLPADIEKAVQSNTSAIALSASNSETGVKIDQEAISLIAEKYNIPLLIDAVSYVGKEPFTMHPGITAVAVSGHKIHGPKGVGALICRGKLTPQITGGPQENSKRAGTENLAGIIGLAASLKLLKSQQEITNQITDVRRHFENGLMKLGGVKVNGEGPRVSNTSNLFFEGVDAETLLIQLDLNGVSASHGSACASGSIEPSRVLTQMGLPTERVRSSIRFSFSRLSTRLEADEAIKIISCLVKKLRK